MEVLVVCAHPQEASFSHAIAEVTNVPASALSSTSYVSPAPRTAAPI